MSEPCPFCGATLALAKENKRLTAENSYFRWRLAFAEAALLSYDPNRTNEYFEKYHTASTQQERYPEPWVSTEVHINPESGETHYDGDPAARDWLLDKIAKAADCD